MAPRDDINKCTNHSEQSEVVSTASSLERPEQTLEGRRSRSQLKGWELREQAKVAGYNHDTVVQATQLSPAYKKKKKQGSPSPPPPQNRRLVNTDRCPSSQIPSGFVFSCFLENQKKGATKLTKESCKLNQMKQKKSNKTNPLSATTTKKITTKKQQQRQESSSETIEENHKQQKFPIFEVDSSDDDIFSECSTITVSTIDSRLDMNSFCYSSMVDSDLMLSSSAHHDRWAGSSETSPYYWKEERDGEDNNNTRRKNNNGKRRPIKEITIPSSTSSSSSSSSHEKENQQQPQLQCNDGYCVCPFCGLSPQEQQKLLTLMKEQQQQKRRRDELIVPSPSSPSAKVNSDGDGDVMTIKNNKLPAWKLRMLQQQQQAAAIVAPPMAPIRQRSDQVIIITNALNNDTAAATKTTTNNGGDKQLFVPTRRASPMW